MGSTFGNNIKISIFGQSHSEAIGVTIDGLPAGIKIDMDELQTFMDRRAPGNSKYATKRKEGDKPEFLSGVVDNITCGAPLTAIIRNKDQHSKDYDNLRDCPRPGHADYTAHVKYKGFEDIRGGGHFSGRLTAPLCIAGGIVLQILKEKGITVETNIKEIHGNSDTPFEEIEKAMKMGDSVGGVISCKISRMPVGVGEPMFEGLENKISQAVFAVPAVKGIEFGEGFECTRMYGSENNDEYAYEDGEVVTKTNNNGGIYGGISSGMDITFNVAIKPTPSISIKQNSISYKDKENKELQIVGRHDPCIVPRALPCIEAAAALAVYDLMLSAR